jgi:hypothetical protein
MAAAASAIPSLPAVLLLLAAAGTAASQEGRWVGVAEVPAATTAVVLELHGQGERLRGQLTLPGRGLRGLPLQIRHVAEGAAGGTLRLRAEALGGLEIELPADPAPSAAGGAWRGRWRQAGLAAPLELRADGPAPAWPEAGAGPLPASWRGSRWRGRYDIGFGERQLTLRIGADGQAAMTVVGRRTTEVAFDEAVQHGRFAFLRARAFDMRLELPLADGAGTPAQPSVLNARLVQGPFESPLTLLREAEPAR